MYLAYTQYLSSLRPSQYRRLPKPTSYDTSKILDFSTNDYLNLNRHPDVLSSALMAMCTYGVGATGARLLSGNTPLHDDFELAIARDKNTSAGLLFTSGFQANSATLSSLLNPAVLGAVPLVFFDKRNHASLYQGVFLRGIPMHRYHHADMMHLEYLLKKFHHDTRPKFIVTETVFGMDGDITPLADIVTLSAQYNAFLYLDEAHATGVLGSRGYGVSTTMDMQHIPHVVMGTMSKALGGSGGYIACHQNIKDFLINTASGFIYSTAPAPAVVGGAFKAWQMIPDLSVERATLHQLGSVLRGKLQSLGVNTGLSTTHIVPIILGDEKLCLVAQQALMEQGIIVSAIRAPTVPKGSERLRIALTSKHTLADIDQFVATLQAVI